MVRRRRRGDLARLDELIACNVRRGSSREHLKEYDAKAPAIRGERVWFVLVYLWRHVLACATATVPVWSVGVVDLK